MYILYKINIYFFLANGTTSSSPTSSPTTEIEYITIQNANNANQWWYTCSFLDLGSHEIVETDVSDDGGINWYPGRLRWNGGPWAYDDLPRVDLPLDIRVVNDQGEVLIAYDVVQTFDDQDKFSMETHFGLSGDDTVKKFSQFSVFPHFFHFAYYLHGINTILTMHGLIFTGFQRDVDKFNRYVNMLCIVYLYIAYVI